MQIEAFSLGRDPDRPDANEDALVIIPGRAYAVIDGVTDRNGSRYEGMLSGRYAARLVAGALQAMFASGDMPEADEVVPRVTAELHAAYGRLGIVVPAEGWAGRLCCTMALAIQRGDALEVVLVGDSGIRLNGEIVIQMTKDLDRVTALLRRAAYRRIAAVVPDPGERERLSRQVTFHGLDQDPAPLAPVLDAASLAKIGAEAAAACRTDLPHVPQSDIDFLHRHGIVNGQGAYLNRTHSVLGFATLDGFPIPLSLMRIERFPRAQIRQIELFTDGYARPAPGFGVAAWEADFQATEREDRDKIGPYLGTKGPQPGKWSDDRTYLGVRLDS